MDEEEKHLFEGALTSFGSLGFIYSVTFKCEPACNVFVTSTFHNLDEYDNRQIYQIAKGHYSALIHIFPLLNLLHVKTQTPVSNTLLKSTRKDFRNSFTRAVAHCI